MHERAHVCVLYLKCLTAALLRVANLTKLEHVAIEVPCDILMQQVLLKWSFAIMLLEGTSLLLDEVQITVWTINERRSMI